MLRKTAFVIALAGTMSAASCAKAAPRPQSGETLMSMRAGEEGPVGPHFIAPKRLKQTMAKVDRRSFDRATGNNYDAALQSQGCRAFMRTYLPDEAGFGDVHIYLKLVSNEDAEIALEDGADLRTYRQTVEIAYLIVSVDARAWASQPARFQKLLSTMFLPMLRSLYPKASLYVTVYDGNAAVANANWKAGLRTPKTDMD